ncbi:MAG TPA: hypothetical protein VFX16_14875 [Pseudonocardiaceae bacterium]|nr:hypothetical protein [Pseudonocardiaceae bacterium]
MGGASGTRDVVQIHITDSLPIQAKALPFADRIEVRFGRAFPVTLVIDRAALGRLTEAIASGRADLETAEGGTRRDQR